MRRSIWTPWVLLETTQAIVVTTHLETGEPRYIEPQGRDWMDALVASSSLPMVTRGKVKFRGDWMFDGGYSDPLPLDKAIEMGGRHMLVVRTRPMGDHASQSYIDSLGCIGTGKTKSWRLCFGRLRAVQRHRRPPASRRRQPRPNLGGGCTSLSASDRRLDRGRQRSRRRLSAWGGYCDELVGEPTPVGYLV